MMMFKVGDAVVHPIYGVGQIMRLDKKQLAGAETRQYFEINTAKTTVWVPIESCETIGLRHLTTKPDLAECRAILKSRPVSLDKDHAKRRVELAERLKQGSFQALCEMVRDLTARSWTKPLGSADSSMLRKTYELLCQEWAAADGASLAQATQEVNIMLLEAKREYA